VAEPINWITGELIIVLPVETFKPLFKLVVAPLTINPLLKVPNPVFPTVNKLVPPLFKQMN
jgi:hypothetical protein